MDYQNKFSINIEICLSLYLHNSDKAANSHYTLLLLYCSVLVNVMNTQIVPSALMSIMVTSNMYHYVNILMIGLLVMVVMDIPMEVDYALN